MNKSSRYIVQWDEQPMHFCKMMCSLLESQTLVDITLSCGSYSLRVHKCVLAASSPYFRRQLQREPYVDKILMGDVKHTVLKALVEFMYCGETAVFENNIYELISVANMLELKGLKAILPQKLGLVNVENKSVLHIKPPMLFCRGERVRDPEPAYVEQPQQHESGAYEQVVDEARVALAKEEAASRHALQMLQNDLATNLFVIEDACTEATVETSLTTTNAATPVTSACYVDVTGDLLTTLAGLQHQPAHQEAPLTLNQLVAETVAEHEYDNEQNVNVSGSYTSFIVNSRAIEDQLEAQSTNVREMDSSNTVYVSGTPMVKRRRGRPRKVKIEDLSMSGDSGSLNYRNSTHDLPPMLDITTDDVKEEHGEVRCENVEMKNDEESASRRCTRSSSSSKVPSTPIIE